MKRPLVLSTLSAVAAATLLSSLVAAPAAVAATVNPILGDGSFYSADPTLLVADDTLYLHAGRDEAGPTTNDFIMNEWQAFSTTDVDGGQWTHHPSLMRPETVFSWATPGRAYAGQVVEGVDGRFYWHVPVHEAASTSEDKFGIGVAVSDTPLGPWTDHIGGPLVSQKILNNNAHNIDPTVLIDNGRVWMYWGSFSRLLVQELSTDMKTRIGDAAEINSGITGFFEAPWLFKRKDTYYLAYAANNAGPDSSCTPAVYHACIAYSTASSPTGPWTPQGTILGPVSSTTSHPAIAEFKGEWYMAYHTADAVGGNHFRRSVAIDHLDWDDSVTPARMLPLQTTPVKTDDPTPTSNVARFATSTASNDPIPVQYWKKALNDGIIRPNPLPPDMWGSYGADRPAQQWIQYDWKEPVRVESSKIQFWNDAQPGSGDGVAAPKSWRLQYWKDGAWTDVTGASAYPTATRELNEVTFDAVTTSRLRAVLDAAPGTTTPPRYSALAVEEWEVHAADATGYAPVTVSTLVGETPDLPETVALTYGDQVVAAPVRWNAVDPDDLAAPGTFEVEGVAEGYAAGPVRAQVTVVDSTVPRVNQALTGTPAASFTAGWNNLGAINNGTAFSTGGANEEIWATWSPDRPATQKVGYDWASPVTIDTLTAQFWRDTEGPDAGDGVAVPQSWTVEVLVDGQWVAPEQLSAAGTAPDGLNRVTFAPVTTTGVRAVLNAQTDGTTYAAVGLTELEAVGSPADTTAPTVTLRTTGVDGAGDWFVSPVRAIASATDDRDSTLDIEISVDGGEWLATEGVRRAEATVTGDGAHTVEARARDAAGNVSAEQSATVSIDATRPAVSGELNASERTVKITGTDAGSEVERLKYALGEPTAWLPYSAPVKVSDDRQVVYVRAIDGAGNESALTSVTVPRSPNAPLVGNVAPLATPTASYTSGWTSVTSVNDESLTGSSWGTWPVVGEQWLQLEWDREVSLDRAGIQFARDAADEANGGLIPPRSWVLQHRDATGTWKPVSTTSNYGRSSDSVNEVTFSAVTTTALRAVMQAWGAAEMGGSIAVHEFQAWTPTTTPPPTDTTPPTVSVTATGAPVAEGFYAGPVRLALEADDDRDESPVVRYRVDGGEWVTWSTAPTVDTSGRHVVEYEATDAAGNTSARGTLNVLVDRDAPVTTAATPAFDSTKPETRVGFTTVDPLSGVAEIETRVAGGAWTALPSDGFLRLAPQGAVDIEYRATDRVGNVEAARTLRVTAGETPGPETRPAVVLGGRTVSAGGSLAVVGTGFTPGETVEVWLHSEPVELTTLTADAQGAVTTVVTIPAATPAGEHRIELRSTDGARTASADLTVTTPGSTGGGGGGSTGGVPLTGGGRGPDGKGLASTGVDVTATPFAIGFLLLSAGLVVMRRRRRMS